MVNFSFETQGTNTYLVYEVSENDSLDAVSLGMLTNNKIHGLAPVLFTQMDTTKYVKYNISAKISVEQFFAGTVNKKRLIGVFSGIIDAMFSAEDYMIDSNSIILDLKYMFVDVSTCETILICLPIVTEEPANDLGAFFKEIMFNTQFEQTENCEHVAKLINYLNSTPVFSLTDFKALLQQIKSNSNNNVEPPVTKPIIQHNPTPVQQPIVTKAPVPVIPQQQTIHQPAMKTEPVQVQYKKQLTPPPPVKKTVPQVSNSEKRMSLFYLLSHYNAENVAKYKSQKDEQQNVVAQVDRKSSEQKKRGTAPAASNNYASNVGFAIPGQSVPIQAANLPQQQVAAGKVQTKQPVTVANTPINANYNTPSVPQGKLMNFGDTTVLGGAKIGETTVLNEQKEQGIKQEPHLIRQKSSEKIMIDKPVFRIGKEKSYVDYFISDNTAISRSHLNIISRDDGFYIIDTNSTNHTYINGVMIKSNVETSIEHGAKISLANEDFIFNMY